MIPVVLFKSRLAKCLNIGVFILSHSGAFQLNLLIISNTSFGATYLGVDIWQVARSKRFPFLNM